MEKDWVIVFRDTYLPRIELLKALLQENNVRAVVLNQQDSSYQTLGEINLFVEKENYLKALHLLKQADK